MAERLHLAWSRDLTAYDFGAGHPLAPVRLRLTFALLAALGLLDDAVDVVEPEVATDDILALVHDRAYIGAVRAASDAPAGFEDRAHGLGTPDNPVFPGMHEAAARIVGATTGAARAVWSGPPRHAVSLAGGLHHAMRGHAAGFCVYNDVAVAIQWLLDAGARRIAYVDVDAHHGDGVERAFWDDPRVLTISIHQSGATLFPGTGFPSDVGGGRGVGFAVNVAMPPGTGDAGWLRALDAVAAPLVAELAPEVLVSQHGCDAHRRDPLTDLSVSVDGMRATAVLMERVAREHAGGRWLATGGGGYALADVVPRAWAHLVAVAAGRPLDPQAAVPPAWRRIVEGLGFAAPAIMSDGAPGTFSPWSAGYDPDSAVDRAIMATRSAIFPLHGLDPYSSW
jgi:acetoin utilization protein AcuC